MKLLKFELLKLRKKSRGWLGPILVFVLIMTAFPLTVEMLNKDIDQSFLSVLWIATLLVMMLATEDIFLEDFNDGTLEQMAIKHNSLSGVITIKIFVYWLLIGLPISLLGALYGFGITSSADLAIQLIPILMITTYIFLNVFSFGNALSLTKGSILGILITTITCCFREGGHSYKLRYEFFRFSFSLIRNLIDYNTGTTNYYLFCYQGAFRVILA